MYYINDEVKDLRDYVDSYEAIQPIPDIYIYANRFSIDYTWMFDKRFPCRIVNVSVGDLINWTEIK